MIKTKAAEEMENVNRNAMMDEEEIEVEENKEEKEEKKEGMKKTEEDKKSKKSVDHYPPRRKEGYKRVSL